MANTKDLLQKGHKLEIPLLLQAIYPPIIDPNCTIYFTPQMDPNCRDFQNSCDMVKLHIVQTKIRYYKHKANIQAMRELIQDGKNVNDTIQTVPYLLIAIKTGDKESVRLLLDNGADPNFPDKRKQTPLMYALNYYENIKSTEIIDLLIIKGANVNSKTSYNIPTWMFAINIPNETDRNNVLNLMIQNKLELNVLYKGYSILEVAIAHFCYHLKKMKFYYESTINLLLSINVNLVSTFGNAPLVIAIYKESLTCINILLSAGWVIDPRYFELLLIHFKFTDVLELFVERKHDLNMETIKGITLLAISIEKGTIDHIKMLINARGQINSYYLGLILQRVHSDDKLNSNDEKKLTIDSIVQLFIEEGVDLNVETDEGHTLLKTCIKYKKLGLVKTLVDAGCDIYKKNAQGESGLMYAFNTLSINELSQIAITDINFRDITKTQNENAIFNMTYIMIYSFDHCEYCY